LAERFSLLQAPPQDVEIAAGTAECFLSFRSAIRLSACHQWPCRRMTGLRIVSIRVRPLRSVARVAIGPRSPGSSAASPATDDGVGKSALAAAESTMGMHRCTVALCGARPESATPSRVARGPTDRRCVHAFVVQATVFALSQQWEGPVSTLPRFKHHECSRRSSADQ
jgi:hypothetical protein